ncbi:MAG: hypothetical protein CL908_21980 [Deltaproteobacteria bacterium]|nr:hypothetical protein [Deltaproteobacteria bacterium]
MTASQPQLDRMQQRQSARFERMGLAARPMPGGRSLLVSMPLGSAPFESISGPLSIERLIFSTVGPNHIKCLRPRPLFGLPLLDIRRCADAGSIEETIRQAWHARTNELRETGRTLRDLGVNVGAVESGSVLAIQLPGESPETQVMMQRIDEAILPSTGPLSGLPLDGLHERVLETSAVLDSGVDFDCLLGSRIQELQQQGRARQERHRQQAQRAEPAIAAPGPTKVHSAPPRPHHQPRVLIVGSELIEHEALRAELTRRGYRTATARSETEALVRLAGMTPDLVLSQYGLGRSDGASLAQAARTLPGIESLPTVLIDDVHHASRKEAALSVGAAGYVITPPDTARFVTRLGRLLDEPRKRRFTRYPQRLAARLLGREAPCLATEVGRGGVFLSTEEEAAMHAPIQCEIALPELGRALVFDGEVLYRSELQGTQRKGLGLRFHNMAERDETALIQYLTWLESDEK